MPKRRVLRKVWGGLGVVWDGNYLNTATLLDNKSDWITHSFQPSGTAINACIIYRVGYFDLSGYELNDETLYPQSVLIQDTEFLSGVSTGTGAVVKRLDLVSTKQPNLNDLIDLTQFEGWRTPGSSASRFNLEEIVGGRMSRYIQTVDIGGFQMTSQTNWGTCAATAGQKLYICQAYLLETAVSGLVIPGSSLVLPSIISTEPDLEYIMRLARGYQVQGEV